VPSYLVEVYAGRERRDELPQANRRASVAAGELTRRGVPVRFLGAISVPTDEMCFYLFEAPSAAAVGEASRHAAIPFERVVEAVALGFGGSVAHDAEGTTTRPQAASAERIDRP
jgi:hypothetical protein